MKKKTNHPPLNLFRYRNDDSLLTVNGDLADMCVNLTQYRSESARKQRRRSQQADVQARRFVLPASTWSRLSDFATARGVTPKEAIALLLDMVIRHANCCL